MNILYNLIAFLFGLAVGSFLNVLIYRLPRGISIINPGSFCPKCKTPIRWYENIPLFSFLFLGGRCSNCKGVISFQYPLVEFLSGLLFLWSFTKYHISLNLFFILLFFIFLIIVSGIDFTHQIIPDIFTLPGIFLGLAFQLINNNFLSGLIGMLFGSGLIFLLRFFGFWVYKKEVMGMGDVLLVAVIGAYVGFPLIIPAIFIAALVGSICGIIYLLVTHQGRDKSIPFGPFLSFGGVVVVLFQGPIMKIITSNW